LSDPELGQLLSCPPACTCLTRLLYCVQASGAGDGVVRLWRVADAKGGSSKALEAVGGIPLRGFVNSLQLGRSGRLLVAGVGQEPRMGRWLRDATARNGVLIQPLQLQAEGGA
jgi:ribosomal RNA-processing protein 9